MQVHIMECRDLGKDTETFTPVTVVEVPARTGSRPRIGSEPQSQRRPSQRAGTGEEAGFVHHGQRHEIRLVRRSKRSSCVRERRLLVYKSGCNVACPLLHTHLPCVHLQSFNSRTSTQRRSVEENADFTHTHAHTCANTYTYPPPPPPRARTPHTRLEMGSVKITIQDSRTVRFIPLTPYARTRTRTRTRTRPGTSRTNPLCSTNVEIGSFNIDLSYIYHQKHHGAVRALDLVNEDHGERELPAPPQRCTVAGWPCRSHPSPEPAGSRASCELHWCAAVVRTFIRGWAHPHN